MKRIPVHRHVSGGRNTKVIEIVYALVDDADYSKIMNRHWTLMRVPNSDIRYARSSEKGKPILMHRLVMGFPKGKVIDHKNHNGLDNRKINLKITTSWGNACNQRNRGISGHLWVQKDRNRWCIRVKHKYHKGFDTLQEAIIYANTLRLTLKI